MENNADKDKRCVARRQLDYIQIRPEYISGGCSSYKNTDIKYPFNAWLEIKSAKIKLDVSYQIYRLKMIKCIGYVHNQAH